MLEDIRLALQGIWSHKMRSFLTMLGIIIGIASIISIVSIIKGTNEQIKENLVGSGNNTVQIALNQGDYEYEMGYTGIPAGVPVISQEQKEEILELEEVEKSSLYVSRTYAENVYYQNTALEGGAVLGIDEDYLAVCGYVISQGRGFEEKDYQEYRKVVLLDESAQKSLFQGESGLGKTVEIRGEAFTVVGIIQKLEAFEPVITSVDDYYTYYQDAAGILLLPDAAWPIVYQYDEPQNVIVKAIDTENMSQAGKKTADILNAGITDKENSITYKAADLLERAKNLQELSEAANRQLLWIASISLLVGGIGVMNIMLVSVTERTGEIGLKKAVGAKKRRILMQFLTEAAVLTSIGGVMGVVTGLVLVRFISKMSQTPAAVSIPAIAGSVVFSMGIGIVFGLLPSVKAANLNPVDALRRGV